jgi:hypothetical protein
MNAGRFDIYASIHKAIRMIMGETLVAVGRADAADPASVRQVLAQVRSLLDFCEMHVKDEDEFVHSAIRARAPEWQGETLADHVHHAAEIAALRSVAGAIEEAAPAARAPGFAQLYQQLAVFVGENYLHMAVEESENNRMLWALYTDAELVAIHDALIASLPPQAVAESTRLILIAATPAERAGMLHMVRQTAPEPVFDGILERLRPALTPLDRQKLAVALDNLAKAA